MSSKKKSDSLKKKKEKKQKEDVPMQNSDEEREMELAEEEKRKKRVLEDTGEEVEAEVEEEETEKKKEQEDEKEINSDNEKKEEDEETKKEAKKKEGPKKKEEEEVKLPGPSITPQSPVGESSEFHFTKTIMPKKILDDYYLEPVKTTKLDAGYNYTSKQTKKPVAIFTPPLKIQTSALNGIGVLYDKKLSDEHREHYVKARPECDEETAKKDPEVVVMQNQFKEALMDVKHDVAKNLFLYKQRLK